MHKTRFAVTALGTLALAATVFAASLAAQPAPTPAPKADAPAVPPKAPPAKAPAAPAPVPATPAPPTAPAGKADAKPAAPKAGETKADPAAGDPKAPAAAPKAEEAASGPERAVERAKTKIQEIEARTDLAPGIRDQAIALYRTALGHYEAAAASAAAATRFQESAQRSPERVAEAKQQLEALQKEPADAEFAKRTEKLALPEAQQAFDAASAEVATIKTDLGQFETRLRDMSSRATTAREEQTAERQALDSLESPDGDAGAQDPLVAEAARFALNAERRARTARINLLEQEVISLPARQTSTNARRDLAAAKLDKLGKRLPILESRLTLLKDADTRKREADAEREARKLAAQHPVLEAYVKDTEVIRKRESDASRLVDEAKSTLAEVQAEVARVRDAKTAAQQVLEIGSIGGEFSELLRAMRGQLPATARLERRIWERDQAIVDSRLKRLQAEEARRALSDTGAMAERVLASSVKQGAPPPPSDVKPALQKLVGARRDLYVQLHDKLVTRIGQLAEMNATERDLLNQTTQLRDLLDSRLLWLPSSAPIGVGWFAKVTSSFAWIADPDAWIETGKTLYARAVDRPLLSGAVLFVVALLALLSRRLRARLVTLATGIGRYATDNYWRTPEALAVTALLAVTTPILIAYAGWLLAQPPQPSEFAFGVGAGLSAIAALLLVLRFLQYLTVEKGLFSAHFGWPERARVVLANNLRWLKPVITPAAFLLAMIATTSAQNLRDGLGRFAFLAGGLAIAIFAARVFGPNRGIYAERLASGNPFWTTRYVWYATLVVLPLAIAGLALWGYYDGASQIESGLTVSIAIAIGAFLLYSLAMRQVLVARRRLEVRRVLERREKARAMQQAAAQATGDATIETPPARPEDTEIDVAASTEQTRKLVRMVAFLLLAACLYFFWREALPSLALLDVPLWQQTVMVDGAAKSVPVTVSNALLALVIAVVTFIAARNLPGLLEITALHRMRIEAGTRYAVSAISRYLIAIVGLIFAFRSIGFDWGQVQWIVAALGVGVGFGLQEIVANFISGLIILFERPVRVGDTVTIGNLTGTVSRIHIRATSMTDGENREIIIPNKSLITEKVINWTLTDSITSVTAKVAVAYGTDTLRAQMLILEAVKSTPHVLDQPAPSVFFIGFGAHALEFEARAFVLQLAHRATVINDIHVAIERALREQAIAIP